MMQEKISTHPSIPNISINEYEYEVYENIRTGETRMFSVILTVSNPFTWNIYDGTISEKKKGKKDKDKMPEETLLDNFVKSLVLLQVRINCTRER